MNSTVAGRYDEVTAGREDLRPFDVPDENPRGKDIVWITFDGECIGDLNNAIATATALHPRKILVIHESESFNHDQTAEFRNKHGLGSGPIFRFIDPKTRIEYLEGANPLNTPDIIIHTNRRPFFDRINQEHVPDEVKNAFKVRMRLPDFTKDQTDAGMADINICYKHQLPFCDNLTDNSVVVELMPTRINQQIIEEAAAAAPKQYDIFKTPAAHPVHTFIIGERFGDNMAPEWLSLLDIRKIMEKMVETVKQTGGSVLISTSPRTFTKTAERIKETLSYLMPPEIPYAIYDYGAEKGANNAYKLFLGLGDTITVTDDTMSMCADAIATGKPVFIYERILAKDAIPITDMPAPDSVHKNFISDLKTIGGARSIDELPNYKDVEPAIPGNCTEQMAAEIRRKMALKEIKEERSDGIRGAINSLIEKAQVSGGFTGFVLNNTDANYRA